MLTTSQADDVLNLVETNTVTSLEADSWLGTGGTGSIGSIRRGSPDGVATASHDLPALFVEAVAVDAPPDRATSGAREIRVRLSVHVVAAGGDNASAQASVRTIAGHVAAWMDQQNNDQGDYLNGLLTTAVGTFHPGEATFSGQVADRCWVATARVEGLADLWAEAG
jgi:hypothetical protein